MKRRKLWIGLAVFAAVAALGSRAGLGVDEPAWRLQHRAVGPSARGIRPGRVLRRGRRRADARGTPGFTVEHEGRLYRFASEENRARFQRDPAHYEPQFGGWCTYAVANGYKFHVDPESFLVKDDRLLLFYKGALGDAKAEYEKANVATELHSADTNWQTLRAD